MSIGYDKINPEIFWLKREVLLDGELCEACFLTLIIKNIFCKIVDIVFAVCVFYGIWLDIRIFKKWLTRFDKHF